MFSAHKERKKERERKRKISLLVTLGYIFFLIKKGGVRVFLALRKRKAGG
jgi:hypothetical protein